MDTLRNKDITLTLEDGQVFKFQQFQNGLYFLGADTYVMENKTKDSVIHYSLLQKRAENKSYFTPHEIKGADTSRKL